MTIRRNNRRQAAPVGRRGRGGAASLLPNGALSVLRVVPRQVATAAGQSVGAGIGNIRPSLLKYIDLHPAFSVLAAVTIVALVCVIYLSQVTAVTNANYDLQALQRTHTELMRTQNDLQLQIGKAQSLVTIEQRAKNVLKMVPLSDQYTYIAIAPGPLAAITPGP